MVNRWNGIAMETVAGFIFLGSRIIVYGNCSHEVKRCLLLKRKAMANLDGVLKSRDITLSTKITASGPITSWEIDGETVETVSDYFGGLQNHCRW